MRRLFLGLVLAVAAGDGASAQQGATLRVTVAGVGNDRGTLRAAVCPKEQFLTDFCTIRASAPARRGAVVMEVPDVPPGVYAVQVYHDENANRDIDRGLFGIPMEGLGFSNGARMMFGPPAFADAAFVIGPDGAAVTVPLRYFD